MCVWWECAGLHLPPLLYMCMSTSTSVLLNPPPQITKQKGLPSGEWAATAPDTPRPPVMDHRPSEASVEKKRNTEVDTREVQKGYSSAAGDDDWLLACPETGHSTQLLPVTELSRLKTNCTFPYTFTPAPQCVYRRVENKLQVFGWLIKGVTQLGDRTIVSATDLI